MADLQRERAGMLIAPSRLVRNTPAPPRPGPSWAARSFVMLLCLAAGGVAAHALLQKVTRESALLETSPSATSQPEELEQTPFRLPELTDQHPRDPDSIGAAPAALVEALDPLAPRDSAPQDSLAPQAAIERGEVRTVAGNDDGADAGSWVPSVRAARAADAARADAAPPAQPPLPLAETIPFDDPPPEAQPSEEQPPEVAAPGESCGFVSCVTGFGCCNPSCGICVAPGETCDPQPCR